MFNKDMKEEVGLKNQLLLLSFIFWSTFAFAGYKVTGNLQVTGAATVDGFIYTDDAIYGGVIYGNGSKLTGISGSISGLTQNSLSKSNAVGTGLIDSAIYDINGNIGIATKVPNARLEVDGTVYITSSTGNIGIGTWVPVAALQVGSGAVPTVTTVAAGDAFFKNDIEIDGTMYSPFKVSASNANSGNYLIVTSGGNVGIGNVNPAGKLEVDGTVYVTSSTGNVGIGTWVPNVGLAVGGGTPSWMVAMVNQNDIYAAGDVEIDGALYVDGFIYGNGSKLTGISSISGLTANNVSKANATGTGLIDSGIYDVGGNVGIGTSTPNAKLQIDGNIYVKTGNIGIGTWSPTANFQIAGQGTFIISPTAATGDGCGTWTTGTFFINSTGELCSCIGGAAKKVADGSTSCF